MEAPGQLPSLPSPKSGAEHRAELSQPHLIHLINCKMLFGAAGVLAGSSVGVNVLLMASLFNPMHGWVNVWRVCLISMFPEATLQLGSKYIWLKRFIRYG